MIYLSLGSNEGNRFANLRKAIALLIQYGFNVVKQSIVLETKAILPSNAPHNWDAPYLNMIISGDTDKSPTALLRVLQTIERTIGRKTDSPKWSSRCIDIDILLWYDQKISTSCLQVPHLELLSRPFLIHLLATMDSSVAYRQHELKQEVTFAEIAHRDDKIHKCFLNSFVLSPQLVGILNVTPDSFSDGGLYVDYTKALNKAINFYENEGVAIVDIGAQSTRPGAKMIGALEEWERLQPILKQLSKRMEAGYEYIISVDSFEPYVIRQAIDTCPIAFINDVTGRLDEETLKFIAVNGCSIIVMHSLTVPPDRHHCLDFKISPIDSVLGWAKQMIKRLLSVGFTKQQIVLDPGIGFSKSISQNFALLRDAGALKQLGCKILIGHSRKSYINSFCHLNPAQRDLETIAISERLSDFGIDYLRVHNVQMHQRFFVAKQAIFGNC